MYNQFLYTNIHIHNTISVDLLALSRQSNLLFQPFAFIFSTFYSNLIFGWALLVGPRSLRSPFQLNQVTHSDMFHIVTLLLFSSIMFVLCINFGSVKK